MSAFFDKGLQVLVSQPLSQLLGTQLRELSEGYAELGLKIREDLKQSCVTSEFKINYVMPSIGELLVARSTVLSCALRQAVCECKIHVVRGSESMLVAVAQGTIVKVEMIPDRNHAVATPVESW